MLHFRGSTEHSYIVDSYIQANNNERGTSSSISMTIKVRDRETFNLMDARSIFLRNIPTRLPHHTASQPNRIQCV